MSAKTIDFKKAFDEVGAAAKRNGYTEALNDVVSIILEDKRRLIDKLVLCERIRALSNGKAPQ